MFTRIAMTALAIVIGTASGALAAAGKRVHSTNAMHDVYDGKGKYLGSDPDSRIRFEILRDTGPSQ
jgi:hypothetical protein